MRNLLSAAAALALAGTAQTGALAQDVTLTMTGRRVR